MKYKIIFFIVLIFMSCVDLFVIPETINSDSSDLFGAGDTTYLKLSPVWDESYGLESPNEISIAPDGRIFVSDKDANSIHVFNQDGSKPEGFSYLKNLMDNQGTPLHPIDVDIDNKMNIFFIDGSELVYVWNQYWNEVGITQVSSAATFRHKETDKDTLLNVESDLWYSMINDNNWELLNTVFSNNQDIINHLLAPHIFYDGKEEINTFSDLFYKSDSSRFKGITSYDNENKIYVVDDFGGINNQHRIIQIDFKRTLLIELGTGDTVWVFKGEFGSTIKGYGTGSGTVNQPSSLDIDYQGNLYYTQTGDFFPVHMIVPNYSGDFAVFTSGFQPGLSDIMNAVQYGKPVDIAVDNDKNSYVVDEEQLEIRVFNSGGNFFKNIKYYSEEDSTFIMNEPVALTVDNRGILYVCDREDKSIYRFKLSNSLDEDIIIED